MATQPDTQVYLFDKPANVKRLLRGLYVACGLLVALDFVIHRHVLHDWEKIPAFYALYGFVGCVLLVLIAKGMRRFLMRPEDYYLRREQGPGPLPDDTETQQGPH
ncbi:MAG: hypothetical protein H7842_05315 [Gammaproteobacteria bacterium SHHR-1]|uniref:hypothetical protein n=1 Tax=Magnetovirga frankeli TaxID=947516 RepID=UPI0012932DEC|nr:hypothetical protein D5125_01430 [gamma proteobacterium SS-5]